ncbi:hypothetical protein [Nevskia soli]|uniref:hypothetical protein n=1 Tax=Nevskia soli TaxID=418856 RepID=UPI0004A7592F|nr:hypothetical protein [Nevskia soli]
MKDDDTGKNWASAINGAFWLGLVLAFTSACACEFLTPVNLFVCLGVGAVVGFGSSGLMLWLFHRDQVTVKDIWRGIGDVWNAFGKF